MITYHCLQGAAYDEAKLLLASNVTVPSNGILFRDARSHWGWTTSRMSLLLIAKSKDNTATIYNDHLFFPLIALIDAIKKIVVLLTSENSNNSIQ